MRIYVQLTFNTVWSSSQMLGGKLIFIVPPGTPLNYTVVVEPGNVESQGNYELLVRRGLRRFHLSVNIKVGDLCFFKYITILRQ